MRFLAWGHPNVRSTHKTTLEITRDEFLTKRGDCILGIRSNRGLLDIGPKLESRRGEHIKVVFRVEDLEDMIEGFVHPSLTFKSQNAIIFRKSDFLCDRTAAILCDKAACDLKRNLVERMKNPCQKLEIEFLF